MALALEKLKCWVALAQTICSSKNSAASSSFAKLSLSSFISSNAFKPVDHISKLMFNIDALKNSTNQKRYEKTNFT